jgi:aspartyl-tRNA(Asn)/glutamyl-tRNA(Gln) amidotransferase subunit A
MADERMYRVAAAYEVARNSAEGGPQIDRIPELEA